MKKELNIHQRRIFVDRKSDAKAVIRKFRITAFGSVLGEGGKKDGNI